MKKKYIIIALFSLLLFGSILYLIISYLKKSSTKDVQPTPVFKETDKSCLVTTDCPANNTCVTGHCKENCSTTNSSGYCTEGHSCINGTCTLTYSCNNLCNLSQAVPE
jgi:hypothetical protein